MKRKNRDYAKPTPVENQMPTPATDPYLFAQAYEADIVRGPSAREAVAALEVGPNGKHGKALVRWRRRPTANQGDKEEEEIWVDSDAVCSSFVAPLSGCLVGFRYDARLLLETTPSSPLLTASSGSWESLGWSDLDSGDGSDDDNGYSSPEVLNDEEREAKRRHIEELQEKRVEALRAQENESGDLPAVKDDDKWGSSDEEPDELQLSFMQKTASHLLSSPNPTQLEMRILANHGNDPRFAFLRGRWKRAWEVEKTKIKRAHLDRAAAARPALGGLDGYGDSDED